MASSKNTRGNVREYRVKKRNFTYIKIDYETTYLTLSELSEKHGVSSSVISRAARDEGWTRKDDYEEHHGTIAYNRTGGPKPKFSQETREYIIDEVASGRPLTEILKEDDMPSMSTVSYWRRSNQDFDDALQEAFLSAGMVQFSKSMGLAEDLLTGEIDVKKAKILFDIYLKTAGKLDPRWGDKSSVDYTSNGNSVMTPMITINAVTDEQAREESSSFIEEDDDV